mmetsp:Transcript_2260/g.6723  ORF Transcript_2260/g.6723 Transcript_2260/m.6723 type:complete len:106 (-) Transcript_2260:83-400(-)
MPARTLVAATLFVSAAALQITKVAKAAPKFEISPAAVAAAPVALAPVAANAFQGTAFGVPINALVSFAPVLLVAVPIALIVIGPGALQQLGRVLSGDSSKYFGEN